MFLHSSRDRQDTQVSMVSSPDVTDGGVSDWGEDRGRLHVAATGPNRVAGANLTRGWFAS